MSTQIIPELINQEQPPELSLFLPNTEPLAVIKNEPPELDEDIPDIIKNVDESHIFCDDPIKSETDPECILETIHSESIFVKTENVSFVKIENFEECENLNEPENINRVIEVQGKAYEQDLKYHCDNCTYKTKRIDDFKRHKLIHLNQENINYFYCYHCSYKSKRKDNLIAHIARHFKQGNISFHCYVCDFVTLKRDLIITHIRQHPKFKLFNETGIETYNQNLKYSCKKCNYKTCSAPNFNRHKIIHLKPEEIQYCYCYHCPHKSKHKEDLKKHISRHFRNGDVPFHCYICDFVTVKRDLIITHIKKHVTKFKPHEMFLETNTEMDNCNLKYHCNYCAYKTYRNDDFKRHKLIHLKQEKIQFFCCYHCPHKSKRKDNLITHISRHFRKGNVPFHCYICDFVTLERDLITKHIKEHGKSQIKCEIKEEN